MMALETFYRPCKRVTEKTMWNLSRKTILNSYYESINFSFN